MTGSTFVLSDAIHSVRIAEGRLSQSGIPIEQLAELTAAMCHIINTVTENITPDHFTNDEVRLLFRVLDLAYSRTNEMFTGDDA